jgi:hypothetical protein
MKCNLGEPYLKNLHNKFLVPILSFSVPSGAYLFVFRKGITANIGPQRHHESLMDAKLLIHANI